LTDAGRTALEAWLREPTSEIPQIRSYALLKLFFGHFAGPEDMASLARAQVAAFEEQLADVGQMLERLKVQPDRKWQMAVAEMFFEVSVGLLEQWKRVAAMASSRSRTPSTVRRPARSRRG
jgi:hypothetical protein